MTHISEYAAQAIALSANYSKAAPETALTYACEAVAESEIAVKDLKSADIDSWVEAISHREDIDVPNIVVTRKSPSVLATAHSEFHTICIRGAHTNQVTVLHEIAHLVIGVPTHGVLFRDELVRLTRAHISVEFASFLYSLYQSTGLEMSPWPASAHQR